MSHFTKISTNISNLEILQTTLNKLDFIYKKVLSDSDLPIKTISVHDKLSGLQSKSLFYLKWDGTEYNIVADLQLWSLNMDFNSFLEKLKQYYAYNSILQSSQTVGFDKIVEEVMDDGSLKVVVQKWCS
uniref:Uncharacterized protein ycf35 n=1 Tax=Pleonosporium borreri TaxID=2575635 RepID=A0A4D6WYR0_9FLOR|nr:hypothetical protein [Pleonosporium borreri]